MELELKDIYWLYYLLVNFIPSAHIFSAIASLIEIVVYGFFVLMPLYHFGFGKQDKK